MSQLQPVRGTHDLLPEECRLHRHIVDKARSVLARFGFSEISTPIFEFTEVFSRTLGETSDVVHKEMYTFTDRGGEQLTLRPEGTAGVARAFISNGLAQDLPLKVFYQGPMFRYERPQKGRQRQFHQVGAELLGVETPQADLELISSAHLYLKELGLNGNTTLELNSIGDSESRENYRKELVEFLQDHKSNLSSDSQVRLSANPLRILDSKDESDQKILKKAPQIGGSLNQESKDFFSAILDGLKAMGIPFQLNPYLVRGLDYYRHCVFEFTNDQLGAQKTVLAGGRYDGLISAMGGPPTCGVGWGAGIERLALVSPPLTVKERPVALIPMGDAAEKVLFELAHRLRSEGIWAEMAYGGNVGKRMKKAAKQNARAALLVGDSEIQNKTVTLKDFDKEQQDSVPMNDILPRLRTLLGL